ncbi:hypothetical protein VCRA2128O305_170131 [Vibrio crassostreae]|nr:hypothetical protein VCRA2116O233_150130 [Vibrio crassostreae]CAK1779553.1 hypothetical protein VCRA2113O222_160125 [Vibrio crassostreae]CAK1784278.1 hypothetical protein VCRA2113O206_170003 [Vibrio crassostreae]CAK1788774.1 hypothetical protein VCRA2110O175_170003 [Vibrio crassostreae]CAK1801099.1 hypothetical protein VCRA2113O324_170002 [Vibrio crassostreae]
MKGESISNHWLGSHPIGFILVVSQGYECKKRLIFKYSYVPLFHNESMCRIDSTGPIEIGGRTKSYSLKNG